MKAKQLIILSFLLSFLLSILVLAASGSARAEEPAKNPAVHLWVDLGGPKKGEEAANVTGGLCGKD